jgi:cytidine deaminase
MESFRKNNSGSGMPELLSLAATVALPNMPEDPRNFWLGAIGIRRDGVLVSAKNGAVFSTTVDNYQLMPGSHAEGRLLRKLGHGGVVYVSRVSKKDNTLAMARPCGMCQVRLRSYRVEKVYYTIDQYHYGIWYSKNNSDEIFEV